MSADVSRIRSNPLLDFAGVELKQGGVVLDADFNEHVAIIDRRLRAATSDILGRSTVSSTTPEAFKITAAVGGGLSIGKGRLYVDGMLAENHGMPSDDAGKKQFDDLLAEVSFAEPWTYATQPYLPVPPALPTGGRHLVYLDVWDRELTHLERPSLVEVAVGVEASSRRQTVWQVRVLDTDARGATCSTPDQDLSGWPALIAASGGRLTTGTFEVPPSDDPCELPPTGGYRGLENQTYRVEIHDPGLPGAGASFKWSRENASVGSRVTSMVSASELELDSLGRDEVLRFNSGDWVEIIDDVREFSQRCGEMRKITVNEAARRITFTPALPAEMSPGVAAFPSADFPRERNLRVRRWDHNHQVLQAGAAGATSVYQDLDAASAGVIDVPPAGVSLLLEHGVVVSFNALGAGFKAGDFWVFAARTADASVESLVDEPPRGIHHHYERLAMWDVGGDVKDCRHPWPPPGREGGHDCSCTACVTPRQQDSDPMSIQKAIDQVVAAGGGTVCLDVGEYRLRQALQVDNAVSLRIVGKGEATVLLGEGPVIQVRHSADIALESFAVVSKAARIEGSALALLGSRNVRIEKLVVTARIALALGGALADVSIRGNSFTAGTGITSIGASPGNDRELASMATGLMDLRIDDNQFTCGEIAIDFPEVSVHSFVSRISGNRIINCKRAGIALTGAVMPGFWVEVRGNVFSVLGDGIVAGLDGLRITDNDLVMDERMREHAPEGVAAGIALVKGLSGDNGIEGCELVGNRIVGFPIGIVVRDTPLAELMIRRNQIEQVDVGLHASRAVPIRKLGVDGNQFTRIGTSAINVGGIAMKDGACLALTGNQIEVLSAKPMVEVEFRQGDCVFSDNHCASTGEVKEFAVILSARTLVVASNRVSGKAKASLLLECEATREQTFCTVLGNITAGEILLRSGGTDVPLPNPWKPLNLRGF